MSLTATRKFLPYGAVVVVALGVSLWLALGLPAFERGSGASDSGSPADPAADRPQAPTQTVPSGTDYAGASLAQLKAISFLDNSDSLLSHSEALATLTALTQASSPDLDLILRFILAAEEKGLLASRQELIRAIGVPATEKIAFHGLASNDQPAQRWALKMFGTMKTSQAVPFIVEGLHGHWDASIRQAALIALSKINSDDAVTALRMTVDDSTYALPLRRIGLYALGETYFKGRQDVFDDLLRLMEPTQEEILRQSAVEVISKARTPRVRAALSELAENDVSAKVRKSTIQQLAYHFKQSPEAYTTVRRAIHEDPDEIVRLAAIAVVARFENPEVVPELVQLATQSKSYAKTAGKTLATLDLTQALDLLEPLIKTGPEKTQLNLIETLALLRTDRSRTILISLRDSDASAAVRLSASKALAILNASS